jgi:hypothetical protein
VAAAGGPTLGIHAGAAPVPHLATSSAELVERLAQQDCPDDGEQDPKHPKIVGVFRPCS